MIKINTLEKAKRISKSLFEFVKKGEINLSEFSSKFAQECGFNELEDAYILENQKKCNYMQKQYITFLDDPRVTIDIAKEILDNDEKAEIYFEENLKDHSGIKFPIQDHYKLLRRCEEILIIFNELEEFSFRNLINILVKMSFEKGRIAYLYPDMGSYGNPELLIAIEVTKLFDGNNSEFFEKMVNYNYEVDFTPENCYYDLLQKVKIATSGIIWTQSNVGQSTTELVNNKNKAIIENVKNRKLKSKEVKEKNLQIFYSNWVN